MLSKLIALFPNDTTIMGGTIGFAVPLEGYRKAMLDSIQLTSQEYNGLDLIYASRIDGIEYEGLKVEQDINKGVLSDFVDSKKHTLKSFDGNKILGDYNELINSKDHEIIMDCTSNKIFINGKKVTSQQIHSQTSTIEVMRILLNNIGKDVHSKDLPISSYSKNKNEMLGKIIIPFNKLTRKELKKDLPVACKGMLYDYYLKLDENDIKIGIIDKLH